MTNSASSTNEWAATINWPALLLPTRLETRRLGDDICIRVFPDQPFVNSHRPALSQEEYDAGVPLRDFLASADLTNPTDVDQAREKWKVLAKAYGSPRAAWILHSLRDSDSAPQADSTGVTTHLFLMPDRFAFFLYQDDKIVYTKTGEIIPDTLNVMPIPAPGDQADPPDDAMFDAGSRWVSNFDDAVTNGMAVRIPLRPEHAGRSQTFSQVIAVGLRAGDTAGPDALEEFLTAHRFTDGIEVLRYGVATNTTDTTSSGFSKSDKRLAESFDAEVLSPTARIRPERLSSTAAGQLLGALGLPNRIDLFAHVNGADIPHNIPFGRILECLWPATGDYFLSEMLGFAAAVDHRAMLAIHARNYLRPSGHLASLRVGNVPYGVIPVSRTRPWTTTDKTGWKASALDSPVQRLHDWLSFDNHFFGALFELSKYWSERAADPSAVPRVGGSNDPEAELVRILGMQARSASYRVRPVIDEMLVRFLVALFGPGALGRLSSMGGLATPEVALNEWINQREEIGAQLIALLASLGAAPIIDETKLLNAFLWAGGEDLYMPLIRGEEAKDLPENYLRALQAANPPSDTSAPTPLLYELLRRSITRDATLPPELRGIPSKIGELTDFPVVEFFGTNISAADVKALASRDTSVSLPDDAAEAAANAVNSLPTLTGAGVANALTAAIGQSAYENLAEKLRRDFSARLEDGLRDALDALTHRLDAWFTTLPARRLESMQARSQGFHWGAYGYVENVTFPSSTAGLGKIAKGGGYVHAPSVGQATAVALLRCAFDSHRDESGQADNPYALNLTSNRMRRALVLMDGVQQGQDIAALLGYQFERSLDDAHLNALIDEFRAAYPIHKPDDTDPDQPAEFIPARNVVNGTSLWEGYAKDNSFSDKPALRSRIETLSAGNRQKVTSALVDLGDATDAVGDAWMLESVFQAVQGNYERSGAAFEAAVGQVPPPELFSLETPFASKKLRHRVCLILPCSVPASAAVPGARAAAEPRLNLWVASVFGELSEVGCTAHVPNHDPIAVTLADLDPPISALDFLYMAAPLTTGVGHTEIEQRIRRAVRAMNGVDADANIELRMDASSTSRSVADAMEVGRSLLDMLGSMTIMRPTHLTHPDEEPQGPFYTEVDQLASRCRDARATLSDLKDLLAPDAPPTTLLAAMDGIADYGISEAMIDDFGDDFLERRRVSVVAEATRRLALTDALLPTLDVTLDDSHVGAITGAFHALFGESFIVLPTFDLSAPDRKAARFDGSSLTSPPDSPRVWLWLQQVAETHPRVRKLETFLMMAEAWGVDERMVREPAVAQLPESPAIGWQALSDSELGTPRVKGMQSVVAFLPPDFTLTCVAGLVADEWTETIPEKEIATGVSFEYDQPSSQAPTCLLLATPGNFDDSVWSNEHLAEIVKDTVALAKIRLVDLDALPEVATAIAPALMFPLRDTLPTEKLQPLRPTIPIKPTDRTS